MNYPRKLSNATPRKGKGENSSWTATPYVGNYKTLFYPEHVQKVLLTYTYFTQVLTATVPLRLSLKKCRVTLRTFSAGIVYCSE
jgi:hypothetical protein